MTNRTCQKHMKKLLFSLIGATLCLPSSAASIEVRKYLGYMWQAVETVDFGTVGVGFPTTYYSAGEPLQIVADGVDVANVGIACSDDTMSAFVEGDDNYLYLVITPASVGEYESTLTLTAEGVEPVAITVTATAEDLAYATIAELKENSVVDGQRYYYTGRAVVSHVENGFIWVNDETGGAQVYCQNASEFMPGDVVSFSGEASSASWAWKTYLMGDVMLAEFYNWQIPTPKIMSEALTEADFYCNVRLPKVRFTEVETTDVYGTPLNKYYFEDENGNAYVACSYDLEGEFAQMDFEKDVDYDISGVVWAYSPNSMTAPSPAINMTLVRTTEPPVSLSLGEWSTYAAPVWWHGDRYFFELEVLAVEDDPYTYQFNNFIEDWNGDDSPIFGTVSPDGKTIGFYCGQSTGVSDEKEDKFFSGYECFEEYGADIPPFRKGTVIYGDMAEDGKSFQIDCFIAKMNHLLYMIEVDPTIQWGCTGGYIESTEYNYGDGTGITEMASEETGNERPEYFDVCGRRVSNPVKGNVYIVRTGAKVRKVVY